MSKLRVGRAVIVEGRDDVRAVQEACEALIIPTHGYGIGRETWELMEKAHSEKGLIILTDPDHAGREIRRKIADKFPDAIHAYLDREEATDGSDIGIENARPEVIAEALRKALARREEPEGGQETADAGNYADMADLTEMGLAGGEGASDRRARVCRELGIGYSNAASMIRKLKGFGIDIDELKQAVRKIK